MFPNTAQHIMHNQKNQQKYLAQFRRKNLAGAVTILTETIHEESTTERPLEATGGQEDHHHAQGHPTGMPHLWREIKAILPPHNILALFRANQFLQKELT